ncbi:MAG: hypothetical protein SPF86_06545, partial [Sodaliphilus sp.]|nr:hypothetical protein [Bacteroidales bacterium]MDY5538910.1 hypothetical protein [Sodaliphilus sp.]
MPAVWQTPSSNHSPKPKYLHSKSPHTTPKKAEPPKKWLRFFWKSTSQQVNKFELSGIRIIELSNYRIIGISGFEGGGEWGFSGEKFFGWGKNSNFVTCGEISLKIACKSLENYNNQLIKPPTMMKRLLTLAAVV